MELGFSSGDDYPVSNIDDPVQLSNEPVRVVKNLFLAPGRYAVRPGDQHLDDF